MTRAEREQAARARLCPKCQATPGRACRKNRRNVTYSTILTPGSPMKGVHSERLALVAAEN